MSTAEIELIREEIKVVRKSRDLMRKERDALIVESDEIIETMQDYFPEAQCWDDFFKSIEALQFNAAQNAGSRL